MTLTGGIISGARGRRFEEVDARALLIAGGLQRLGVREGDCVCILMRNDIAFLEASYAVMTLGGYAVPVNWHFKPEEISYIIKDTATRVLIGHTDLPAGPRCRSPRYNGAQRADPAGDHCQLQDRSGSPRHPASRQ